jgi:hypothetical protein
MNVQCCLSAAALAAAMTVMGGSARAQVADGRDEMTSGIPVNYTKAKVGTYTLPELIKLAHGPDAISYKSGSVD